MRESAFPSPNCTIMITKCQIWFVCVGVHLSSKNPIIPNIRLILLLWQLFLLRWYVSPQLQIFPTLSYGFTLMSRRDIYQQSFKNCIALPTHTHTCARDIILYITGYESGSGRVGAFILTVTIFGIEQLDL